MANSPDELYDGDFTQRESARAKAAAARAAEQGVAEREEILDRERWRQVLDTASGKHVIGWLIEAGGVMRGSYVREGGLDGARATDFNEGRRSLALEVIDKVLAADPEGLIAIQRFQRAKKAEREAEVRNAAKDRRRD
jgi:hypothetical protein